jgi:methionine-rich copper-binding protein CopC
MATQITWATRAIAVLVLLVGSAALGAPAASAHAKLVSSSPANGSSSDVGPSRIVLTFDEAVTVTSVRAQNDQGTFVAVGDPVVDGSSVSVTWPGGQQPGLYRVGYVVISDDGHPVEGTIIFTYATTTPGSPTSASSGVSSWWIVGAVTVVVLVAPLGLLVWARRRPADGDAVAGTEPVAGSERDDDANA